MKIVGFIILIVLLLPAHPFAQARKPMTVAELVTYSGKDREQVLYAGAKTEGKVTLARGRFLQGDGQGL
jgi:hypothetical protein